MKKIMVTGSSGFIGKNLVKRIEEMGIEIILLEVEYVQGINWQRNLLKKVEDLSPDCIFHVGACSDTLIKDVNFAMELNFQSTDIISNWSRDRKVPLIYSSSAAVYGSQGLSPENLYAWSKFSAEKIVLERGGVALRYFNVYGPGEEHKGNMASIFYQAYIKSKSQEYFYLFPGKPKRDFVYIDDVVEANLHSLNIFDRISGSVFDVGTCSARMFEEGLDYLQIRYKYHSEGHIPKGYQMLTCANSEKLLPGWLPKYDLKTGIGKYKDYLNLIIL